jgi:hypothetical protein
VKRLTRKISQVLHLPAKNRLTAYSGQAAYFPVKKIMKWIQQHISKTKNFNRNHKLYSPKPSPPLREGRHFPLKKNHPQTPGKKSFRTFAGAWNRRTARLRFASPGAYMTTD